MNRIYSRGDRPVRDCVARVGLRVEHRRTDDRRQTRACRRQIAESNLKTSTNKCSARMERCSSNRASPKSGRRASLDRAAVSRTEAQDAMHADALDPDRCRNWADRIAVCMRRSLTMCRLRAEPDRHARLRVTSGRQRRRLILGRARLGGRSAFRDCSERRGLLRARGYDIEHLEGTQSVPVRRRPRGERRSTSSTSRA